MAHYDVRCTFTALAGAEELGRAWAAWLHEEHLQDALDAGASSARVVRVRAPGVVCESRYTSPSAVAFAAHEQAHAPRLRQEGLSRFPLDLGLVYARCVSDLAQLDESTGRIVIAKASCRHPPPNSTAW